MTITSPAFNHGESIPKKYTCDGENISPPLNISGVPPGAKSLVLIMDDPDVPTAIKPDGVYDHWVLYNILPTMEEISEDVSDVGSLGKNSSGDVNYTGPCPPDREHRYFFKLYALNTELRFQSSPTKGEVQQAMEGHVLVEAELMGTYNRSK